VGIHLEAFLRARLLGDLHWEAVSVVEGEGVLATQSRLIQGTFRLIQGTFRADSGNI
jgi:hypothetical protein